MKLASLCSGPSLQSLYLDTDIYCAKQTVSRVSDFFSVKIHGSRQIKTFFLFKGSIVT